MPEPNLTTSTNSETTDANRHLLLSWALGYQRPLDGFGLFRMGIREMSEGYSS